MDATPSRTMTIEATACGSASDALAWARDAGRDARAIRLDGGYYVTTQSECHRLEVAGVPFAYLGECAMPDGSLRIVTVPVN